MSEHDETVAAIREHFAREYKPFIKREEQACIFWAESTRAVLAERGQRAAIVAGSAQWQMVTDANDDGVSATHFAYEFELGAAASKLSAGRLPEMHAWVVTERHELIDVTTGFQAKQMRGMLGKKWDAELALPKYVWSAGLPPFPQMVYRADRNATTIALALLRHFQNSALQGAQHER